MALSADDREAASGDHLIVLGATHGLGLVDEFLVHAGDLGEGRGVDIDAELMQAVEHLIEHGAVDGRHIGLVLAQQAPVGLVQHAVEHLGVDAEVVAHELVARHLLGVAAEQDVRAAAGHVGGSA